MSVLYLSRHNALGPVARYFIDFGYMYIDSCVLAAGIRTLQCILLKVALLMGVEVHTGVTFDGLVEPDVTGAESRPSSFFCK